MGGEPTLERWIDARIDHERGSLAVGAARFVIVAAVTHHPRAGGGVAKERLVQLQLAQRSLAIGNARQDGEQ